jgi:hypothetical protein
MKEHYIDVTEIENGLGNEKKFKTLKKFCQVIKFKSKKKKNKNKKRREETSK